MAFSSQIVICGSFLFFSVIIFFSFRLIKNRKRSAESIYKLIDDLEKKYIY